MFFLIIGWLVYRRGAINPINISFALSCLFIAVWVTVGLVWKVQLQMQLLPDLTSRFGVASGCVVTASLLTFSAFFPVRSSKLNTMWLIGNYVIALIIALSAFTSWSVSETYYENGKFIRVFGPLYALFAAYVVSGTLLIVIIMIRKYKRLQHQIDKQKVKYVTFGMVVSLLIVIFFMLVLPYLGFQKLFFLGQVAPLIMVSFSAYAIIRYNALDISAFASRFIVWICHFIIIAALIHLTVTLTRGLVKSQDDIMVTIIALITLAVVMLYLERIKPLIDRLILHRAINMSRILEEFSQELNVLKPLDKLSKDIQDYMKKCLMVDQVSIYYHHLNQFNRLAAKTPDLKPGKLNSNGNGPIINQENRTACQPFLDYIELYDEVLELEQVELDPKYHAIREPAIHYFHLMSSVLVVPLIFNKKLLGILNFGKKQVSSGFDTMELQLLSILRHDISVAFNNSQLYQKVNDLYEQVTQLNETLEERVAKRTFDLEDALNQLQRLDQLKSDFISVASHELRTPLTSVKGAISLAMEYELDGEVGRVVSHLLEMSHRNIDRLILLINDVLDLSKLESVKTELQISDININEIVDGACDALTSLMEDKQIHLIKNLSDTDLIIEGNRSRLHQVMINLLGNAIKFSPLQGMITITVIQDQDCIECSIRDEGAGIALADQQKIFEKFSQIRDAESKTEGSGLGLTISKRIIENHKGSIWINSLPNQGSTFIFRLPLKKLRPNP